MRRRVGAPNRTVPDVRTRSDLRVRIDSGITSDDDWCEAEVPVLLDTESTNQSFVDLAAVAEGEEVEFSQRSSLIDVDVLPNVCTQKTTIKSNSARMNRKNATSSLTNVRIDNPPPEVVVTPPSKVLAWHTQQLGIRTCDKSPVYNGQ